MNKRITIIDNGKEYALEFTRRTVQQIEARGFNINELDQKIMTNVPLLIHGAFLANHPKMRQDEALDIWSRTKNHEELLSRLAEMYAEPIMTLMDEPVDDEKNATWAVNW